MSFHSKAQSRRSIRSKVSVAGSNVLEMPSNDVEDALERMKLEDSVYDLSAESRNIEKIKSMAVPLAERKSIK